MWQTDQRCRHGVGVVWLCGLTLVGGGLVPQTASAAAPFTLQQLTATPSSCSGNFAPAINADGTGITFHSDCDLTPGGPGNADGNFEIFLFNTASSTLTQVTNSSGCNNLRPRINADGTRITFASRCDLIPGSPGNADGDGEIFLFNTASSTLTQVTNSSGCDNRDLGINADGTRITFASTCDLTPGSPGNADGNDEIFLFNTATSAFTQVTNTTGCFSLGPLAINADGTRITFSSSCELTPGSPGNADGNFEIFLFNTASSTLTQVTTSTGCDNEDPTINAGDTRITFSSTCDLTPGSPGNADGTQEIFLFDTTAGFTQITNTSCDDAEVPSINADGRRIAFESECDPTGGNPDGNDEIFLAAGPSPPGTPTSSAPTLSPWGLAAAVALLSLTAWWRLRRPLAGR